MTTNFLKTEKEITKWLEKYEIKNYTLIPNDKYGFAVDINGNVDLSCKKLNHIPVRFNSISRSLYCYDNNLTSLEFFPQNVGGYFYCEGNELLGSIQEITDFNQIKEIHMAILERKNISGILDIKNGKIVDPFKV